MKVNILRQKPLLPVFGVCMICLGITAVSAKPPAPKSPAGSASPTILAERAATSWLALVDTGKYAQSWDTASPAFQKAVTKAKWISQIQAARGPLGKMVSRTLEVARYEKSPAGAPPGEYVGVQYATDFTHKNPATETLVLLRGKDGSWKTTGYFVK